MSSQHRHPQLKIRPPGEVVEAGRAALDAAGRTVTDFVTAALREVAADPEAVLERLAPHWPDPPRRGRPPKVAE